MNPINLMRKRLEKMTQSELASELGISVSYLSDILNDRRDPGPRVLEALGVEKVVSYRKKSRAA
jgi:transcriptional regulator with XRE-family HTH domain